MINENEIKQFVAEFKKTHITSKVNLDYSDKDGICAVFDFDITEEEQHAELSLIEDAYYKYFRQNLKAPQYTLAIDNSIKKHSYNFIVKQV